MSDGTAIEWTDATWNVITGCSVLSPGCKNCYAMKLAGTRLKRHPSRAGLTHESAAGPVWTGDVRWNEQWLLQPLQWKRPRQIFVCAHGDLFHENVPDAWIDRVMAVMALARQHTYQVLTKRARRMREYFATPGRAERITLRMLEIEEGRGRNHCELVKLPLPHVHLGVSAERQQEADLRIPELLATPAAVRWVSLEPLLGSIDLERPRPGPDLDQGGGAKICQPWLIQSLDWVVVGGESGDGARPMHPDWARSQRDQCAAAGVPFNFKQWGSWLPVGRDPTEVQRLILQFAKPTARCYSWPDGETLVHVGKKAAGRLLDGVRHDDYPKRAEP